MSWLSLKPTGDTQMSKHTPGPWSRDKNDSLCSPDGRQVYVWNSGLGNSYRSDETDANARLIAAAPELLEALEAMLPGAEAMGWETSKARAAIAKARGES